MHVQHILPDKYYFGSSFLHTYMLHVCMYTHVSIPQDLDISPSVKLNKSKSNLDHS